MTQDEFERMVHSFDAVETMRSKVYYSALSLIKANFVIEAHLLLLSTWNFARFQYVVTSFDLLGYERLLQELTDQLQPLAQEEFATLNLRRHRKIITDSFRKLAMVRGIEFTGATKVLHLHNPSVFIMWDSAIRGGHTPKKDYANLDVVRSGFWNPPIYPFDLSGVGYHDFLVYCQSRFNKFLSPAPRKTLAKCIDEFNYCTITDGLPKRGGS